MGVETIWLQHHNLAAGWPRSFGRCAGRNLIVRVQRLGVRRRRAQGDKPKCIRYVGPEHASKLPFLIPFCRTIDEGVRVQEEMAKHGLRRGKNDLEVYVICEIPSNLILAEAFSEIFDGFSIGSNDLTQLILGVDRHSEIVAPIFDERNPAVKTMIAQVIKSCRAMGRKIGICGQAPSDYPEFAEFLVQQGIYSISLNPDSVIKTTMRILETEHKMKSAEKRIAAAGTFRTT